MISSPFAPWPSFTEEEAEKVKQVMLSNKVNYWTGHECRSFEKEFAQWVDCKKAIAVANGTLALELALIALGVGQNDEVIVPPRTFIASASAIVSVGAKPVFADINVDTQNIDPESIQRMITEHTKVIICVHLAGVPCDMDAIMAIAKEHDLFVVEDCAQAHGARYKGKSVGTIGDIGAWSFCQDKIMSTGGEGGMVTTNNEALWKAMWSYKDHGKSFDKIFNSSDTSKGFKWIHDSFGSNFRMTEMQAAIGRIQLHKMRDWTNQRTRNAQHLQVVCDAFDGVTYTLPQDDVEYAYYKFYFFVSETKCQQGWSRDRIIDALNEKGVPAFQGACPELYKEEAFTSYDLELPNAKSLGERSIMMLVHPTLTQENIDQSVNGLSDVLAQAIT